MKLVEYIAYRKGIYLTNKKSNNASFNKIMARREGDRVIEVNGAWLPASIIFLRISLGIGFCLKSLQDHLLFITSIIGLFLSIDIKHYTY